jgi:hypothetical protein
MEAAARQLSIQVAREAKKIDQQIQNDLIVACKDKKHNNSRVLAQEETILEDTVAMEPVIAESTSQRPQRRKHEPKRYRDYQK